MSNIKAFLTEAETKHLRGLHQLLKSEVFKLKLTEANTALVVRGQEWCETQRDVIKLIQQHLDAEIVKIARNRNIKGNVTIDLKTRAISLVQA